MVITSNYFGLKKLGIFGVLISRKGISESGIRQQKDSWIHNDKMIVCVSDEDLKKMIRLKLEEENPEQIIDWYIRKLRQSL